jgi:TonB family protein
LTSEKPGIWMVPVPLPREDDDSRAAKRATKSAEHGSGSRDVDELASQLAARGIHSSELVLDLVLHDLAEEAWQIVPGTGAAIALERNGELVCRAAAGTTAPDLGIRMNTRSGLSGACVSEGLAQLCRDTESDNRVDTDVCRQLGVRTIAALPIFNGEQINGILQVYSAQPNAFSAEDLIRLQSLAGAVADAVRKTQQAFEAKLFSAVVAKGTGEVPEPLSIASIMQKVSPHDPGMKVLRGLVIGLAILVAVLLGFDIGWHKARGSRTSFPLTLETVPDSAQPERSVTQDRAEAAGATRTGLPAPSKRSAKRPAEEPVSQGGLVVYQNGKVIYRQGPVTGRPQALSESMSDTGAKTTAEIEPAAALSAVPKGITEGRLIQSVKPKYPPEAVQQRIEGAVILHGIVGIDGMVHELAVMRGDAILRQAALEAVRQWRYEPYKRDGTPIAMPIDITIDFNLSQ